MRRSELYKYNPRQSPPEELAETFVAHHGLLNDILDTLRDRAKKPANQHFLLIGPRGIGKSNLLCMIRRGIEGDAKLRKAYEAVQTAEEEYSVVSLRDLFGKVIELLQEAVSDPELDDAATDMARRDNDDDATDVAIAALRDYSKRKKQKIVLLVDNLDLILQDQMSSDAQRGRLRDILMNDSFLVVVGAAPTHFREVSGYDRPFYNFFRLLELPELTLDQMAELLKKRAELDKNTDVLERFDQIEERLRAIHHLTGGNPRLALMLYQLYTHTELPEVRAALMELLDDLTPYYQARMNQLAPQQRKVMDTFARLGRLATPTELARETRLKVNQINSILQRLREHGFVTIGTQIRRKKTYYMVSERLFRIWHQMRFSSAGRTNVQFLIEFIRNWYSPLEWRGESERLLAEYGRVAAESRFHEAGRFVEHLQYMVAGAPEPEWGYEVEDRATQACIEADDLSHAGELIEERIRRYSSENKTTRLAETWFLKGHLHSKQGDLHQAMAALEQAVLCDPGYELALHNWGCVLSRLAQQETGHERERLFREACSKFQAALRLSPREYDSLLGYANALLMMAELKEGPERARALREACAGFEEAAEANPEGYDALHNWGVTLRTMAANESWGERERLLRQACEKHGMSLRLKPNEYLPLYNGGVALYLLAELQTGSERESVFGEARRKFRAALAVKPDADPAFQGWLQASVELANEQSGQQQDRLLGEACTELDRAIQVAGRDGRGEKEAFYRGYFMTLALPRVLIAIEERDLGCARRLFDKATEHAPGADPESVRRTMVHFFSDITREQSASLAREFLGVLEQRGLKELRGLLEPFAKAIEYWEGEADSELLDRLNPELRELVECILRGTKPTQRILQSGNSHPRNAGP